MRDEIPAEAVSHWLTLLKECFPWLTTILLSVFASLTQYAERVKAGEEWSWRGLFLDIIICTFVGITVHLLCTWQGIDGVQRSFLVAVSAHMGTRAMMQLNWWQKAVLKGGA